jgi:hypothetical protein
LPDRKDETLTQGLRTNEQCMVSFEDEHSTFDKKAPASAMFLLTCSFEEASTSYSLKRTQEGPFQELLLISSGIQSFQKTFDFEVKM